MLGLESVGDDAPFRSATRALDAISRHALRAGGLHRIHEIQRYAQRPRAWVARITGHDARYGVEREFLRPKKDYTEANGTGSRGVYLWYELPASSVYEVNAPLSWKHADRYFCRSERGQVVRMTREAVDAWLAAKVTPVVLAETPRE